MPCWCTAGDAMLLHCYCCADALFKAMLMRCCCCVGVLLMRCWCHAACHAWCTALQRVPPEGVQLAGAPVTGVSPSASSCRPTRCQLTSVGPGCCTASSALDVTLSSGCSGVLLVLHSCGRGTGARCQARV